MSTISFGDDLYGYNGYNGYNRYNRYNGCYGCNLPNRGNNAEPVFVVVGPAVDRILPCLTGNRGPFGRGPQAFDAVGGPLFLGDENTRLINNPFNNTLPLSDISPFSANLALRP